MLILFRFWVDNSINFGFCFLEEHSFHRSKLHRNLNCLSFLDCVLRKRLFLRVRYCSAPSYRHNFAKDIPDTAFQYKDIANERIRAERGDNVLVSALPFLNITRQNGSCSRKETVARSFLELKTKRFSANPRKVLACFRCFYVRKNSKFSKSHPQK